MTYSREMRSRAIAVLWLVAVSCGGGGSAKPDGSVITPGDDADVEIDAPPGPSDYSIAINPTSLTLPIASAGTVDVTITRTNFADPIALAAVNVPPGVTVTFEPPTLGAGVTTSVATVSIAGGIAEGSGTLSIDATAGLRQKSASLAVSWHRINVSGTVFTQQSGVTVGLVGRSSVTTGAGGTFSFADVTPPYDLYTVSTASFPTTTVVHYYKGLTRPDPIVLMATGFLVFSGSSANVSGAMTGHPMFLNTWVGWGDTSGSVSNPGSFTNYTGVTAFWPTAATKNGTLHALSWSTKGSGQTNQIYYGSTAATLNANGNHTVNVTFAAAASTAVITGTITPPAGMPDPSLRVWQNIGGTGVTICDASGTQVDTNIPVLAAGKSTFSAEVITGAGQSRVSQPDINANTDVSFTMVAPPVLGTPANAATGVNTSTDFTFTPPANHAHLVRISTGGTTKVSYTIYTTASSVRIPSIPEVNLPSGQAFTWYVESFGPNAHVNDVAVQTGPVYPGTGLPSGPRRTHSSVATRTFTSQ